MEEGTFLSCRDFVHQTEIPNFSFAIKCHWGFKVVWEMLTVASETLILFC